MCPRLGLSSCDPPEVVGEFTVAVGAKDWGAAVKALSFQSLALNFQQVGVAPNDTEEEAALWLGDLLRRPLGAALRKGIDEVGAADLIATELGERFAKLYNGIDKMSPFLREWRAVQVLLSEAVGEKGAHTASVIRSAVASVEAMDKKNKLYLGMMYGELGKQTLASARAMIAQTAKDEVASRKLHQALSALRGEALGGAALSSGEDFSQTLAEALSAIGMLSRSGLEEQAQTIASVSTSIVALGKRWFAMTTQRFPEGLRELTHKLCDLADQHQQQAQAASDE